MKTKLLGMVVVGMLALMGSAADADTFDVNIAFSSSTTLVYDTDIEYLLHTPSQTRVGTGTTFETITGSFDVTDNVLTNVALRNRSGIYYTDGRSSVSNTLSIDGPNWTLDSLSPQTAALHLEITNGLLTFASFEKWVLINPGLGVFLLDTTYSDFTGTITKTPLPAALPLFATGLGMFYAALRCRKKILLRRLSAGTSSGGGRSSLRSPPSTVASASQISSTVFL